MDSFNTRRGLDLVLEHYHDASWTQIAGTLTGLVSLDYISTSQRRQTPNAQMVF